VAAVASRLKMSLELCLLSEQAFVFVTRPFYAPDSGYARHESVNVVPLFVVTKIQFNVTSCQKDDIASSVRDIFHKRGGKRMFAPHTAFHRWSLRFT